VNQGDQEGDDAKARWLVHPIPAFQPIPGAIAARRSTTRLGSQKLDREATVSGTLHAVPRRWL
jgi:hypothetical protein